MRKSMARYALPERSCLVFEQPAEAHAYARSGAPNRKAHPDDESDILENPSFGVFEADTGCFP